MSLPIRMSENNFRKYRFCSLRLGQFQLGRLAIEKDDLGFQVLHMTGAAEADQYCNTREAREVLGLEFKGDLDQFRKIR